MDEFERIDTLLKPLTNADPAALGLADDCALLPYIDGKKLAVTKDAIVERVHFFENTPAHLVARKLLGVNLSDMAAMGATPKYYFVAAAMNKNCDDVWFKEFTTELAKIQQEYDITLLGGDSTRHDGPLTLTLTMMGEVVEDQAFYRAGARVGDSIFVTGTIGDSALGLLTLTDKLHGLNEEDQAFLVDRYHVPKPRNNVIPLLKGLVSCATDISDGLVADLTHICDASGVGAEIQVDNIPLSSAAAHAVSVDATLIKTVVSGGDDYELIFTVSQENRNQVIELSNETGCGFFEVGRVIEGDGVQCVDASCQLVALSKKGYIHK
jgi:thiamine-monophosphate kinase